MGNPGNWFAIAKMRKTPEEERNFKKRNCIFTYTLGQFSVSACANQLPGFSVSEISTPNGLFQRINGLKD